MTTYGFLSTYPPTRCGLATFTSALASAMASGVGDEALVVRVDDLVPAGAPTPCPNTRVVGDLRPGSEYSRAAAAEELNGCDVVVVQHEYGIYGGSDGDEVLDVLTRIHAPCIVVLHTVLEKPSVHQREILQEIARLAGAVVAMTQTAKALLIHAYSISAEVVSVIPHGVDPRLPRLTTSIPTARPVVLSWGLLGPGKGIEWGIRAFAQLTDLNPRPIYRVLGQTHPKVLSEHGEKYRLGLKALAVRLGVVDDVQIDGGFREADELAAEIAAATMVLLPYDSREQSTSGVLVEAIAAGKLVIATRFPHAIELLSGGNGELVGHANPGDIADAIRRSLLNPVRTRQTVERAREAAAGTSWADVGERYRVLASALAVNTVVL